MHVITMKHGPSIKMMLTIESIVIKTIDPTRLKSKGETYVEICSEKIITGYSNFACCNIHSIHLIVFCSWRYYYADTWDTVDAGSISFAKT